MVELNITTQLNSVGDMYWMVAIIFCLIIVAGIAYAIWSAMYG